VKNKKDHFAFLIVCTLDKKLSNGLTSDKNSLQFLRQCFVQFHVKFLNQKSTKIDWYNYVVFRKL